MRSRVKKITFKIYVDVDLPKEIHNCWFVQHSNSNETAWGITSCGRLYLNWSCTRVKPRLYQCCTKVEPKLQHSDSSWYQDSVCAIARRGRLLLNELYQSCTSVVTNKLIPKVQRNDSSWFQDSSCTITSWGCLWFRRTRVTCSEQLNNNYNMFWKFVQEKTQLNPSTRELHQKNINR